MDFKVLTYSSAPDLTMEYEDFTMYYYWISERNEYVGILCKRKIEADLSIKRRYTDPYSVHNLIKAIEGYRDKVKG